MFQFECEVDFTKLKFISDWEGKLAFLCNCQHIITWKSFMAIITGAIYHSVKLVIVTDLDRTQSREDSRKSMMNKGTWAKKQKEERNI